MRQRHWTDVDHFDRTTYGERLAADYDTFFADVQAVEPMIELLATLAGGGPALELGVGTGRVAVPLAQRGVRVIGVDASAAMLARAREKSGSLPIELVEGDFAAWRPPERVALSFSVFNTFFMLPDEAAQRACLSNAAAALEPHGSLVLELFVPDPDRFTAGGVTVKEITAQRVIIQASHHDEGNQLVESQDIVLGDGRVQLFPTRVRYLWPEQLDDLAAEAGLVLTERWADWSASPFTVDSSGHVSVYRLAQNDPSSAA